MGSKRLKLGMATRMFDSYWSGSCFREMQRYDEAAEAYEEGLKTSPGDAALGRGLDDVLKAQSASKAPAGEYYSVPGTSQTQIGQVCLCACTAYRRHASLDLMSLRGFACFITSPS